MPPEKSFLRTHGLKSRISRLSKRRPAKYVRARISCPMPGQQVISMLCKVPVQDFLTHCILFSTNFFEGVPQFFPHVCAALHARVEIFVQEKLSNPENVHKLRSEVLASKKIRTLEESIRQLHPRRSAKELEDVLERRIAQMIRMKAYKLCQQHIR